MEPDGHISVDDIFSVLSHNRRRLALQYFRQYHNPIDLDDLAHRIARWEQPPATVPADVDVEQVRTALHKTHLPKLEEMGFVEYQRDERSITTDDAKIVAAMENATNVIEFMYEGEGQPEE